MTRRSLVRILVVLVVGATAVLGLGSAAHAGPFKTSRVDQDPEIASCAARQGTYAETAVADGSVSSCTFGSSVEACEYDSSGEAAGSKKNCTRITGRSALPELKLLRFMMATVDALRDGSEPPAPPGGGGSIPSAKPKGPIKLRKSAWVFVDDIEATCRSLGGEFTAWPIAGGGGGRCKLPNGWTIDCIHPGATAYEENCLMYRLAGGKPLEGIFLELFQQIRDLSPDPGQPASGETGGDSGSTPATKPSTTTTKPSTTKPTTTTTKPPTTKPTTPGNLPTAPATSPTTPTTGHFS